MQKVKAILTHSAFLGANALVGALGAAAHFEPSFERALFTGLYFASTAFLHFCISQG